MWYLAIDDNSKRYFIKPTQNSKLYITRENSTKIDIINVDKFNDKYRMVGEAFEGENRQLELLLEDTVF